MPVFVRNLALEYLVEDGVLESEKMLAMYGKAKWRHAHGAFYLNHTLPSGVEFIFRAIKEGEEVRILGTDTHPPGQRRGLAGVARRKFDRHAGGRLSVCT